MSSLASSYFIHSWDSPRFADQRPGIAAGATARKIRAGTAGRRNKCLIPCPQLTCTLPEIGSWKTGFLWTLLVLRVYVYLRDGTVIPDHAKNKGIEIEPQKLVWSHTECQQEVKPWNIFERCFFLTQPSGFKQGRIVFDRIVGDLLWAQYINLGDLRSYMIWVCFSWYQLIPNKPIFTTSHNDA